VEGTNQECFNEERLMTSIRQRAQLSAPDLFKELIAEIQKFCGGNDFTDDVSIVGVGVKRIGTPPENSCPVKPMIHLKPAAERLQNSSV
jgi:hypothetical protein